MSLGTAAKFQIVTRDCTLTAQAGAVLLQEFFDRLGVASVLNHHLHLKARRRGYSEAERALALCWNMILGGDCLRDLNALRGDPGLHELLGVASLLAPTSAGEYLRQFELGDLQSLHRVLRELAARMRPHQTSTRVTFDLDASLYEQCSTRKDGSRKNYQGQTGYYPLFCFWAEEDELVNSHLLRGNARAVTKAEYVLRQSLRLVPPDVPRFLRADSEFYDWDFIALCEAERITYAITADQSESLKTLIAALPEGAWRKFAGDAQVAEVEYTPSHRSAHRYIVKRALVRDRAGQCDWRYHVIVTNDRKRSPKKVLRWYYQRCTMENQIKEHKRDFGLEKMPTQRFQANWAWLLLGQLAWNLVAWFKRLCLPASCHAQTVKTLRQRLFQVAGKIVHQSRQRFLVISDQYWFQDLWRFALEKLTHFKT